MHAGNGTPVEFHAVAARALRCRQRHRAERASLRARVVVTELVGRDLATVRTSALINLDVSVDGQSAKRATLRKLAYLFRSRGHAANIESSGLPIEHAATLDGNAEWVPQSWRDMDMTMVAAPLGDTRTAVVLGRPGPEFRPSEVARLGYLAGIVATMLR